MSLLLLKFIGRDLSSEATPLIFLPSFIFILLFLLPSVLASSPPVVNLSSPNDAQLFNTTNIITFVCNATDDEALNNLTLYHNISGDFQSNQTKFWGGELQAEDGNVLLMHFNNDSSKGENSTHVYDWSGNGNDGTVINVTYNGTGGKFDGAFEFYTIDIVETEYESIKVADDKSLDLTTNGTVEAWIKVRATHAGWQTILTKGDNEDHLSPYALWLNNLANPNVAVYLGDGTNYQGITSTATLNLNQWYHVAFTWDNSSVKIYINGSLDKSEVQTITPFDSNRVLRIGKNSIQGVNGLYFNGTIDELSIYNKTLTGDEIAIHAGKKPNNVSQSWTINNVPDGKYGWNCLAYDNESQSDWGDANRTFTVDVNPPTIKDVEISPNSTDDIDPLITISVTANVTDVSNVSVAILQWKEVGSWNNVTMMYNTSTGLYNASFDIDADGGVYYYQIWSNDTLGHAGVSDTQNITALYDYTWTRSPADFGTISGLINTEGGVGNLTINNTGDDALNFSFSDDWPWIVKYNGSEAFSFNLNEKEETNISITLQFAGSDEERELTINITASHPTQIPSPTSAIVDTTVDSYSGGPYLKVYIVDYPTTILQSQSANLTAKVKNIGNETATQTWLNWTLPTGWTNSSGNLTQNVSNLTSGSIAWNNLTVTLDAATATIGMMTIFVNATSAENVTDSDSEMVTVSCNNNDGVCGSGCSYLTDSDCSAPVTQVISRAAPPSPTYDITIRAPKRVDVNRGETKTMWVNVSNTIKGMTFTDLNLTIDGYPLTNLRITPEIIEKIDYNETKRFKVEITAPIYKQYEENELILTVKGKMVKKLTSRTIRTSTIVLLVIHKVPLAETLIALNESERAIQDMEAVNFSTNYLNKLLEEAISAMEKGNYDQAEELMSEIIGIKDMAFRTYDMIQEIEYDMEEAKRKGLEIPETKKMYTLTLAAVEREDYRRAEERARDAIMTYLIETKGEFNPLKFVQNYWWAIIPSSFGLAFVAFLGYRRLALFLISKELESLVREERTIEKLTKDVQTKYFKEKAMSKTEYDKTVRDYETRLVKIEKRRTKLLSRKIRLIKFVHPIENLRRENKRIQDLMEATQKRYFELGTITSRAYSKTMLELEGERAEVLKNLETESMREGGFRRLSPILEWMRKKKIWKWLPVLILLIIASFTVNKTWLAIEVVAGTKSSASRAIATAENEIREMQELGLGVTYANDTLNEAKLLFSMSNYKGAESLAKEVAVIKETALSLSELIDATEGRIYEASAQDIDVSPAEELFKTALKAYEIEDYVETEKLLNQATDKVEELEAKRARELALERARTSVVRSIRDNWGLVLLTVGGILVFSVISYKKLEIRWTKKKIKSLEREEKSIKKLMKDIQRRHFKRKTMPKSEYEMSKGRYSSRMIKIGRELSTLRKKLRELERKRAFKSK